MADVRVLIVDDDGETTTLLRQAFGRAGVPVDCVRDAVGAMEKLRERKYCAIVLDPMIRQPLNGYAVLNFIEMEHPELLERLFLLTGMSEQTIRRTAPAMLPRLFRKPSAAGNAVDAVIAVCGQRAALRKSKGAVLLIEDDRSTAIATIEVLEDLGYSVEWLENGAGVSAALAGQRFDVVLLDLVLPDVDGFHVLESFRDERPGLLRRVIVTTGMPGKYLESIDLTSVAGILRKPLDVRALEQLLAACAKCGDAAFEGGGELPETM